MYSINPIVSASIQFLLGDKRRGRGGGADNSDALKKPGWDLHCRHLRLEQTLSLPEEEKGGKKRSPIGVNHSGFL